MINNQYVSTKRCKCDQGLPDKQSSRQLKMVFYSLLLLFNLCLVDLDGFNVDTRTSILYLSPNHTSGIFFGYSVALHLDGNKTWLLVGAPLSDVRSPNGTMLRHYGAVFKCDTAGSKHCQDINVDNEPERRELYPRRTRNVVTMEIKSGQMLGGTLQSKHGIVVVCAPRYTEKRDIGRNNYPMKERYLAHFLAGGCHVLQTNLSKIGNPSFLKPCKGSSLFRAYCQAGFSADITKDSVLIGKVGWSWPYDRATKLKTIQWAGGLDRYSFISDKYAPSPRHQQEKLEYLGYDVASGYFSHRSNLGIAAGAPKGQGLKGKVLIYDVMQDNQTVVFKSKLQLPKEIKTGTYFGSTLCAVDLNNDGLSDLLIGAPLFTDTKDEGRVYVYLNKKGVLTHMPNMVLQGDNKQGARFGTAISNVGDLNRDGYQDVVIGAPYEGHNNSGAVYVYYGSKNGIETKYKQKITASKLSNKLKGFGYSISGAVDVDMNAYPDIAVGSFWSDQAVLLKTRRIVEIEAEINLSRTKIVLENKEFMCNDEEASTRNKCLNVSVCFQFKDRETSNRQDLKIAYSLEVDSDIRTIQTRRMYFYNKQWRSFTVNGELTIPRQEQTYCLSPYTVYISHRYQFLDLLKPLTFDLTFSLADKSCLMDHDVPCPVLDAYRPTYIRNDKLMIQKQCEGQVCRPELSVTGHVKLPGDQNVLRVGSKGVLSTVIEIQNSAHDASYQTTVALHFPKDLSYIGPTASKSILCSSSYDNKTSKAVCHIGNPFKAQSKKSLTIEFSAADVTSNFNITVVVASKSKDTNLENNELILPVTAKYLTDVQITGISQPNEVIYHGKTLDFKSVKRQRDIGPVILQTILIENQGPSFVDGATVHIQLPHLKTKRGPESILLYLQEVELSGGAGRCNAVTNPLSIAASNSTFQGHPSKQRKPASSSIKRIDCSTSLCHTFNCRLGMVLAGSTVHITITARLWQSALIRAKLGSMRLVTRASLTLPPQVMQTNTSNDHAMIELLARPGNVGGAIKGVITWWIYLVAVLAGLILLLFLIFVMYKFGFFSRTRPNDGGASSQEIEPMKV